MLLSLSGMHRRSCDDNEEEETESEHSDDGYDNELARALAESAVIAKEEAKRRISAARVGAGDDAHKPATRGHRLSGMHLPAASLLPPRASHQRTGVTGRDAEDQRKKKELLKRTSIKPIDTTLQKRPRKLEADQEDVPSRVTIIIRDNEGGAETTYSLKPASTFAKMMKTFDADMQHAGEHTGDSYRFLYDGGRIVEMQTPAELGMEAGQQYVVDAFLPMGGQRAPASWNILVRSPEGWGSVHDDPETETTAQAPGMVLSQYHDCANLHVAPSVTVKELMRRVQLRIPIALDDFVLYDPQLDLELEPVRPLDSLEYDIFDGKLLEARWNWPHISTGLLTNTPEANPAHMHSVHVCLRPPRGGGLAHWLETSEPPEDCTGASLKLDIINAVEGCTFLFPLFDETLERNDCLALADFALRKGVIPGIPNSGKMISDSFSLSEQNIRHGAVLDIFVVATSQDAQRSGPPRRILSAKASPTETSLQQCYTALSTEVSEGKQLDEAAVSVMAYLDGMRQRAVVIRRFIASASKPAQQEVGAQASRVAKSLSAPESGSHWTVRNGRRVYTKPPPATLHDIFGTSSSESDDEDHDTGQLKTALAGVPKRKPRGGGAADKRQRVEKAKKNIGQCDREGAAAAAAVAASEATSELLSNALAALEGRMDLHQLQARAAESAEWQARAAIKDSEIEVIQLELAQAEATAAAYLERLRQLESAEADSAAADAAADASSTQKGDRDPQQDSSVDADDRTCGAVATTVAAGEQAVIAQIRKEKMIGEDIPAALQYPHLFGIYM